MLLTGPFAMLSILSFDFHSPPCTEGFLIHLSPLWQLPPFPSVAQFPCVLYQKSLWVVNFEANTLATAVMELIHSKIKPIDICALCNDKSVKT